MIERLVAARTHVGRNCVKPFVGIGKHGIYIKNDAAEWINAVAHHLTDAKLGQSNGAALMLYGELLFGRQQRGF